MKKILATATALVLSICSLAFLFAPTNKASAYNLDEADKYFVEFVTSDTTFEGTLSFSHRPLYDEDFNVNGREYTFSIGNVNGYALMTEFATATQTFYEIEEVYYNATSPFSNCNGLPVYITHNTYLEFVNEAFYDVLTGAQITDEVLQSCVEQGFNYFGGTTATFTNTTVDIEYATKTVDEYSIQLDLPDIVGSVPGGSCAHTAGAIILTYYDRFCENIMPDFDPCLRFGNFLFYRDTAEEVYNMTLELVDYMLIGEPHPGTTFTEFQYGMQNFVSDCGYTYTSTDLFTNGAFNFNNYKTAVENNLPCAIFLTNFTMSNGIRQEENLDSVGFGYCPVSHVAAACGYKVITYYDANNNVITSNTYLKVASGLNSYGIGFLSVNNSTISKAISILVS
ncbi:MAG: hypothetical protein IJZ73_01075 [Clostridia bacterium]|nr:hypothetical protein [Clostridia bacterium]